ncbi:hypothetical protein, partial [Microcystis aeruginosa]|uniref:hypothetical protein n=1 Tax=Microcystis aeruginosa TaxID=1126 RepID=UPI001D1396C1
HCEPLRGERGVGRINKNNLRPPADRLISTSNLNYEQLINPELKPKNPQLGIDPLYNGIVIKLVGSLSYD